MSKLYDHKSGKWVIAPENKVDDLVKSGNYTFESGTRIDVVSPDGQLGDIPSDNAHGAFAEGFRWATQADKQADHERKLEAIRAKAGDNGGTAMVAGVLRGGTLGLSDVALRAGEEMGALPEGVVAQQALNKEMNPVESGVGEVGGIIGSTLLSGGTSLLGTTGRVGQAGYKFGAELGGKALAAAAGKEAKETLARKIIAKVVPVATGSAVENAVYGLGQGVSEAALGKSEDVVDHLVSGVGMGALTGLTFGAGFGAAGAIGKPLLAKAAEAGGNLFDKAITGAARVTTKVAGRAALNAAGEARLAGQLGDLVDTPLGYAARHMAAEGRWDEIKDIVKQASGVEKTLVKESADLAKGLNYAVSKLPELEKKIATETLTQNAGDVTRATDQLYKQVKQAYNILDQYARELTGPTHYGTQIDQLVTDAADSLYTLGTDVATKKADDLYAMASARSNYGAHIKTEGQEVAYLRALKDSANHDLTKMGRGGGYDITHSLVKNLDGMLKGHKNPMIAQHSTEADALYTALSTVRKAVGKNGQVSKKALARLTSDPEYADVVSPFFTQLSEYAPELGAFVKTAKNSVERKAALNAIRDKIVHKRGASLDSKLSVDDLEELLIDIGADKDKFMRLDRLKSVQATLTDLHTLTPMDRAIRILKATGQDASKIEQLLPHQKHFEMLDQLQSIRPDGNFTGDLIGRGVKSAIGGALGGPLGAVVGASMGGGMSVRRMIHTLTAVERMANKGAKALEASVNGTVKALTSDTVRRISMISRTQAKQEQSRVEEKRKDYKKLAAGIQAAAGDPEVIAENVAKAVGQMQGTPNLKAALAQKMTVASQYLAQHMPKDPLAGRYMSVDDSGWEPNDSELSAFHRRMAVVQDPKVAMEKIADGSVSPEEIDALRTVYPEIYNKLKNEVIGALMEKGTKIPYSQRIAIGTIFGMPTDPSMEPAAIAALQSTYDIEEDEGGRPEGSTEGSGRKPSLDTKPSESVATETSEFQQ